MAELFHETVNPGALPLDGLYRFSGGRSVRIAWSLTAWVTDVAPILCREATRGMLEMMTESNFARYFIASERSVRAGIVRAGGLETGLKRMSLERK